MVKLKQTLIIHSLARVKCSRKTLEGRYAAEMVRTKEQEAEGLC